MSKITRQLREATEHISLTHEEKVLMRERLVSYMEYKPIHRKVEEPKLEHILSYFRMRHYSGALMIAILVLSSTFGVSFAAGDALPGDLLYGVKVNINEEIKTVFIKDESRLAWEQERAERRLVEASQLAAEGRLDDKAQEKVSQLFAEHAEKVVEQVLAYEDTDPVLAAEASGAFEDSLETHEAVLARLIVETEEESDEGAKGLVEQVRSASMEVEKLREEAEEKMEISEEGEEGVETNENEEQATEENTKDMADSANMRVRAAYRAKERAETLLLDAEALYTELEVDSVLRGQAEAQTAFGKIHMDKGEVALAEYELSEAYSSYKKAGAAFQKVAQLLEVAKLFSVEIYTDETSLEEENTEEVTAPETITDVETVETAEAADVEEPSTDEVVAALQGLRTEAEDAIAQARTLLLTQEGFDEQDVEEAHKRIKDAVALILRGEIGMVLEDYEDAQRLFTQAYELAEITVRTLEREGVKDNVKGVSTLEKEAPNLFELTHTYSEGIHTYSGEIETEGVCETLEGLAFVTEGSPEEIALEITVKTSESEEGCIEVTEKKMFSIKTNAGPDATLTALQVNGETVEWNLTEEQPKEDTTEITTEDGQGSQNPESEEVSAE